jgi:hypothetical protein
MRQNVFVLTWNYLKNATRDIERSSIAVREDAKIDRKTAGVTGTWLSGDGEDWLDGNEGRDIGRTVIEEPELDMLDIADESRTAEERSLAPLDPHFGRTDRTIGLRPCHPVMQAGTRRKSLFRPCIDLHGGVVKQIVGGSLKDDNPEVLRTNFVARCWLSTAGFLRTLLDIFGHGPANPLQTLPCFTNYTT